MSGLQHDQVRTLNQILGTIQRRKRVMREKKFNDYKHILVKIRLPVANNTDMITEDDMKVAKELLLKEWIQQREDIDHWFGLVAVEKKPVLPTNRI